MFLFPPTLIIRHRKENIKKCTLQPLKGAPGFSFYYYPLKETLPDLAAYCVLTLQAPPLTIEDQNLGLILIDGTWNLAQKMIRSPLFANLPKRSLPPGATTAYPRYQTGCSDPQAGLASIEALYIAYAILQRSTGHILDHYHWKDPFLKQNHAYLND